MRCGFANGLFGVDMSGHGVDMGGIGSRRIFCIESGATMGRGSGRTGSGRARRVGEVVLRVVIESSHSEDSVMEDIVENESLDLWDEDDASES